MTLVSQSVLGLYQAELARESIRESTWEACAFSQRDPFKSTPNEDACMVILCGDDSVVLAVADGCGGMRGGAQASQLALQCLEQSVKESVGKDRIVRSSILDGIERANEEIQSLKLGSACTIAVVEIHQGVMRPYHVGDSVILVTTNRGRVRYESLCHSPIGYAVESGLLAVEHAIHHEDRHLLSNYVGSPDMRIEIGPTLQLLKSDRILIASDGLFDNLSSNEIVERLRKGHLSESVERLTELATQRMNTPHLSTPSKPDDLTLVAFRNR